MKAHSVTKISKKVGKSATMIEIIDVDPKVLLVDIKQISGSLYLQDQNRTFIPYDKHSYHTLKTLIDQIIILPTPGTSESTDSKPNKTSISPNNGEQEAISVKDSGDQNAYIRVEPHGPNVEFNNLSFYIQIPYDKEEVRFLKTLQKTYWSSNHGKWISKATVSNLDKLQQRYHTFDDVKLSNIKNILLMVEAPYKVNLYYMPQSMEEICVKIEGHSCNHEIIKRVSNRRYDKLHKRWIVPNDQHIIDWIKTEYTTDGAMVYDKLVKKGKSYKKVKNHLRAWLNNILRRLSPEKAEVIRLYSNSLVSGGYQATTIRSYCSVLIKYMEALKGKHIKDSTVTDYEEYITSLYDNDQGDSQVNTYNSALKYCFKKIYVNTDIITKNLIRPRKGRKLPKILSVNEIDRLLRATDNIKHVTLLYTLYSSGLRLNEILSLQLTDMAWDRSQILVRGKGGKERMVPMADHLKRMLIRYYDKYKPEFWLFEGQNNEVQYSESSVRKVIKNCALKANIGKRATTHTMRHCFATHLMDSGVGIRYIQELLGHKDIKTTLIYTHVTNLEISKIQSPLDNLIKGRDDDVKL
ncbi:MAG: integrase/recombinase XerD [Saprospiraceae bacterium]|jgi:integrase/recombinase XerD